MLKIEVLKRIDYRGCPIYIRKLDRRFEFLVIFKNRLYSHYIDIKPTQLRRLFFEKEYTEKQLSAVVKMLLNMACVTIDSLKDKK